MEVFALSGARVCGLGRERRTERAQGKFMVPLDRRGDSSYSHSHYATTAASLTSGTSGYRPGRRICIMRISLLGGDEGRVHRIFWFSRTQCVL